MPQCTNCNYKWKVKEVLSLGFSENGKSCPKCWLKQYISVETQRLFTLGWISLVFVPFLLSCIKLSDKNERFLQ